MIQHSNHTVAISFGVQSEVQSSGNWLESIEGLKPNDLREIEAETGAAASVDYGSVGVGASSEAIQLLLEYRDFPQDVMALVGIGSVLRTVVRRVGYRRKRIVATTDGETLAALALAGLSKREFRAFAEMKYAGAKNLDRPTVPPRWAGTDDRDVWAVKFVATGKVGFIYVARPGSSSIGALCLMRATTTEQNGDSGPKQRSAGSGGRRGAAEPCSKKHLRPFGDGHPSVPRSLRASSIR